MKNHHGITGHRRWYRQLIRRCEGLWASSLLVRSGTAICSCASRGFARQALNRGRKASAFPLASRPAPRACRPRTFSRFRRHGAARVENTPGCASSCRIAKAFLLPRDVFIDLHCTTIRSHAIRLIRQSVRKSWADFFESCESVIKQLDGQIQIQPQMNHPQKGFSVR